MEDNNRVLPELPFDALFNILTRLPVKSVFRSRSVCTLWRRVVSDPRFVETHLQLANRNTHGHKNHMVMTTLGLDNLPRYIESISYETRGCTRLDFPFGDQSREGCEILASCNGIFVVGMGKRSYFLWNPLTRVYTEIPGQQHYREDETSYKLYGLGFDGSCSSFKVLRVVRKTSASPFIKTFPRNTYNFYDNTIANLYNSQTNSWRKLTSDDFPYYVFTNEQAILVNGYPHYVVIHRTQKTESERIEGTIICFDFSEEKFKEVPMPNMFDFKSEFKFGSLDGMLCLVVKENVNSDVWVMSEYGVKESWTRVGVIIRQLPFVPLHYTNDNRILWETTLALEYYSIISGDRIQVFSYFNKAAGFSAASYVESLVLPPGGELVRY